MNEFRIRPRHEPIVGGRRGNTIVLVTGILVLLVIIATAYVTRTQAGRIGSDAFQKSEQRDNNARIIGNSIADEIASALFPRPLPAPGFAPTAVFDSNITRLPIPNNAVRHGIDPNPLFPYNSATFHVVPYTNWPDQAFHRADGVLVSLTANLWPAGPGNPNGGGPAGTPLEAYLAGEGNPIGNPGYNDTRWLRDLEPMRWDPTAILGTGVGIPNSYSHWRHLSNIARPDNGYRVCIDISDIGRAGVVSDLNIPIEQWLPLPHAYRSATGNSYVPATFWSQWNAWFTMAGYEANYANNTVPPGIPPNLYCLWDLDGDGFRHNFVVSGVPQDLPHSEFIPGTARNWVSRVLADADGDGYTDSFWFLAPTPVQNGIRQIVAVSIVDNCARLGANATTRLVRNDFDGQTGGATVDQKTRGLTPTDLAIVGQLQTDSSIGNFNVGLFDNWKHWFGGAGGLNASYNVQLWDDHMRELGMFIPGTNGVETRPPTAQRLDFWRNAASTPLAANSQTRYTPFSLADEIELRMYEGQNYPWIATRFESVGHSDFTLADGLLRASTNREENNEYLKQLFNRDLVLDSRHRLTLYSAARNDLMPPWLWETDTLNEADYSRKHKLDLRRENFGNSIDVNNSGGPADLIDARLRLRDVLERALIDRAPWISATSPAGSYYGNGAVDVQRTEEMAAAFGANIIQFRDKPPPAGSGVERPTLEEAIAPSNIPNEDIRFMGMEAQPFLVEAFVGHVYRAVNIPPADLDGDAYGDAGDYIVLEPPAAGETSDRRTTIVVVQIANPFDDVIDLSKYRLVVFGREYELFPSIPPPPPNAPHRWLEPATDEKPTTAIYYSIVDDFGGDDLDAKWLDFLDLGSADLTNATIVRNVGDTWSKDRDTYDTFTGDEAIALQRREEIAPTPVWVTVDRIDPENDQDFRDTVVDLRNTLPDQEPEPINSPDIPIPGEPYPLGFAHKLGPVALGYKHWVQWVRATRAWGADLNGNGWYDVNEKCPRYIFADRAVVKAGGTPVTDPAVDGPTYQAGGNRYKFDQHPDGINFDPPVPWFTRPYMATDPTAAGGNVSINRKPTFFNMDAYEDPAYPACSHPYYPYGWSFPNKGWYTQGQGPDDPPFPLPTATTTPMRLRFPLQMLQKDDDFEQIGELLNVWLYGHKLLTPGTISINNIFTYQKTETTFSEYLSKANDVLVGSDSRINRLRLEPGSINHVIGVGDPADVADPRHGVPPVPAGVRVLDAFVCDGAGLDPNNQAVYGAFMNAMGFDGRGTQAMINANTAPPEVLSCLPHWDRLVHETGLDEEFATGTGCSMPGAPSLLTQGVVDPAAAGGFAFGPPFVSNGTNPAALLPRIMLPWSLVHYREQFNGGVDINNAPTTNLTGHRYGPSYERRRRLFQSDNTEQMRGDRGLASIGEVMLLNRRGQAPPGSSGYFDLYPNASAPIADRIYNQNWLIDLGVKPTVNDPYLAKPVWAVDPVSGNAHQASIRIGTDRSKAYDPYSWDPLSVPTYNYRQDRVAGDVEESNALFAGASNIITTRSDTFTVHFRIRSFRQNPNGPVGPVWDATNPEFIVDDSRYVMLVDRSSVNRPGDKPKILYLEKLPN